MNRCLMLAVVIVVVSSGVNELNVCAVTAEALGTFLGDSGLGVFGGSSLEEGAAAQPERTLWETLVWWTWGEEDDEETARLKKKLRLGGTLRLRNKEAIKSGLLKQG